jgi:ubiquinone/menaquinone biosynthesis C-methylase UbiE
MTDDPYKDFAERYDLMKLKKPDRDEFFRNLFAKHNVKTVLDCACGTGHELILFHSFDCDVQGSDRSESMLKQARKNLSDANLQIPLEQKREAITPKKFLYSSNCRENQHQGYEKET